MYIRKFKAQTQIKLLVQNPLIYIYTFPFHLIVAASDRLITKLQLQQISRF